MTAAPRRMDIAQLEELARERGGRCLSTEYVNSMTPLEWECAEGHRWVAIPNNVRRGTWCPVCARSRQGGNAYSVTIETLREVAHARGGECLEDEYLGVFAHHRWRCAEGHEWEAICDSVRRGSWCPVCTAQSSALSIEVMQEFAAQRGWRCLSKEYRTNQTRLEWECAEGHRWLSTYNRVQQSDGCPRCRKEERRAAGLERCQAIAAERGGRCVSTEYRGVAFHMEWECAEGHLWSARPNALLVGSWCPTCNTLRRRTGIEVMQALAALKGGECLSCEYVTNHTHLRWRCAEGHEWESMPSSIKAGSWCPVCANLHQPSYTIEDMQAVAEEHGGRCLSPVYQNNRTPLLWQCELGHQWRSPYKKVRVGNWCPECEAALRAQRPGPAPRNAQATGAEQTQRRRRTLEEAIAELSWIVEARGGRCLTSEIAGGETRIRLQCSEGHTWQARVRAILRGHWCPACGRASSDAKCRERFGLLELDDQDEVALWAELRGLTYVQRGKPRLGRSDFFRCASGHMWEVYRGYSALGSWCPVCGTRGEDMGVGRGVR